jgi:hypothetical protein
MAKESEGKELAKDVKLARRIEKEELGKMGMQRTPKTKTPRLGGVGGGGMNPIDLEKVPGRRPLKMAYGGGVKKMAAGSMKMVEKDGKKVPAFAADGVGKMARGGKAEGKMMKSKGRNVAKATMQRIADKKVKGHESRMHKGAKKK